MKHTIIIADNLSDRWFGMPPLLSAKEIESWEGLRQWREGREIDLGRI